MDSSEHIPGASAEVLTEEQLELLVAKYTLEYLHRWTNGFDAVALAEVKKLLDTTDMPEIVVQALRCAQGSLPN